MAFSNTQILNALHLLKTNSDDVEHQGEEEAKDAVEETEDTKIVDDVCQHYHDWSEILEDPQKEESFHYEDHYDDRQNTLAGYMLRVSKDQLENNIGDASIYVDKVDVVPGIFKVNHRSIGDQLYKII